MSSIEAIPSCYDPADWQLVNNNHSYEASKYQTDLLVGYFEEQQQELLLEVAGDEDTKAKAPRIRHLLVHPGVASTNIVATSLNCILMFLMELAFYFVCHSGSLYSIITFIDPIASPQARMLGSANHVITPFNGAVAAVHLSLVALCPLAALPRDGKRPAPLKFASQATRLSKAYVDASVVEKWDERKEDGADAAQKCEELFQSYLEEYGGQRQ